MAIVDSIDTFHAVQFKNGCHHNWGVLLSQMYYINKDGKCTRKKDLDGDDVLISDYHWCNVWYGLSF